MGWVSILDPAVMTGILDIPATWRFIGYFCLGYPQAEDDSPELERAGWEAAAADWRFHFSQMIAHASMTPSARGHYRCPS